MIEIKNFYGEVIKTVDAESLRGAGLKDCELRGADLNNRDLCGADLRDANLRHADLMGANLRGAKIPLDNHNVIAEILRQAAYEDVEKRMIAGLILVSRDWCWQEFLRISSVEKELRKWAIDTIKPYVEEGSMRRELLDRAIEAIESE